MPDDEIVPEQEKSTKAQQESQPHAEVEQSESNDSTNAPMPKRRFLKLLAIHSFKIG
jgi:hypothetical protein